MAPGEHTCALTTNGTIACWGANWNGQTVLAQVSWGYHDAIGCYLALDPAAATTLRAARN